MNAGMIDNDGIVDYPNVYELDANGDPVVNGDVSDGDCPSTPASKDVDDVEIKYAPRCRRCYEPNERFQRPAVLPVAGGRSRRPAAGDERRQPGQRVAQYRDYEFGGVQVEPSEREVELTALEMEVGLGFATLTSSTSYYDHTGTGISDNSGVYARNGWFAFYGSSPRPIAQAERFYDDSAFAQELRLVSNGDAVRRLDRGGVLHRPGLRPRPEQLPRRLHPVPRRARLVRPRAVHDEPGFPVPPQPEIRGNGAVRRSDDQFHRTTCT